MLRPFVIACCVLTAAAGCGETPTEEPPVLPQSTEDRVGLPPDYAAQFKPLYVFDRADNRQVRVVYANDSAIAGQPFRLGSILVMETYRAKLDPQGVPVVGADGRYQRDALAGIFVMRKEKWFGHRYQENQTGEWEYATFRPDKSANVVGDAAGIGCAICHLDAGPSRDWVYRANLKFSGASGAIPQQAADQPADKPLVLNYTFVPGTTTVKVGTRVTWANTDQVKHAVTANDGAFSGLVPQGSSSPTPSPPPAPSTISAPSTRR
ncbi:MAG: cytochrome P460 family protein [Gemmatimonadetes bacterium]|nr:cytochrome P460 family protein [Gemmatimonadota bacterium]